MLKRLRPLITQSPPSRTARVSSQVASLPWSGSVSPKPHSTSRRIIGSISSRCSALPDRVQHQHEGKVAHAGDLRLQVAVQAQRPVGQVLADHRHVQVASVRPSQLGRQRVAVEARGVGAADHLAQQLLPLLGGRAPVRHVGARELAAVVEELRGLGLERCQLTLDESVQRLEQSGQPVAHAGSIGTAR